MSRYVATSHRDSSEYFRGSHQQDQSDDHGHHDRVMANGRPDVQPTAFVANQEEKMLKWR